MIDGASREIPARLKRTGLGPPALVFNADHGDFMGDHGLMLKGPMHFQGLVRVPLLWKDPQRKSVPVSHHLAGTVAMKSRGF